MHDGMPSQLYESGLLATATALIQPSPIIYLVLSTRNIRWDLPRLNAIRLHLGNYIGRVTVGNLDSG